MRLSLARKRVLSSRCRLLQPRKLHPSDVELKLLSISCSQYCVHVVQSLLVFHVVGLPPFNKIGISSVPDHLEALE